MNMPSARAPSLFAGEHLNFWLDARRRSVIECIVQYDTNLMVSAPEEDLVAELYEAGSVRCPAIDRDRKESLGKPREEVVNTEDPPGRPVRRVSTVYTVVVPFDGESAVFHLMIGGGYPVANALVRDSELRLMWRGARGDTETIRRDFGKQLDTIVSNLELARKKIDAHNALVERQVRERVRSRRSKLINDRETQAALGFPIRKRPDAHAQAVPLHRRTVTPTEVPQATPAKHEWVLLDRDYEDTLEVLRNMRNAFERNPTTTARLNENMMRDILLIGLNARFEGQAAGEVFNGDGKTDILIRVSDHNVFIGECKIIDPAHKQSVDTVVREALDDQLLRYLVWRDTKAALVLFIRSKDVTAVIEQAVATIEQHPNCSGRGSHADDERHDFVMHPDGDTDREIHLALLPFVVSGGGSDQYGK